jgi:hypothetical protein
MQRVGKFLRLSGPDRWFFAEAVISLGIARLVILMVPFRWISPFLGRHMAKSPETIQLNHMDLVKRVSWAVQTASRHMPWKCKCLTQALAGKGMLKRYGVQSTLYLGVTKDDGEKLKPHAWLQTGHVFVTGARDMKSFTVVSTFAEEKH